MQERRRTSRRRPPAPDDRQTDALAIATIVGLIIVGLVVVVDLLNDGQINPNVLALFAAVFGPLTPALIMRTRGRRDD